MKLYIVFINFSTFFILYIIILRVYFEEYSYTKIYINNLNFSQIFLNSIDKYNQIVKKFNNIFKKIKYVKGRYKAIIVLLNYNEIKPFINRNILFLKQNYHDKLLFFVTENVSKTECIYSDIKYNIIDITQIFYSFPYKFNDSFYTSNYRKRGKWNYQHMCRFFFRDIFLHPSLFDVDVYMRLDSESILNTTINLFSYMNENIIYMHNRIFNDAEFVVRELKDYTLSLVKALNINIKDKNKFDLTFKKTVLAYYNNFEICRIGFFRSKEMFKFINLVDLSYGQFLYRWGDAPLRFISLSLFAENYTKIPLPRNIKYCHKDCNK